MPESDGLPRVLVVCDEPINKLSGGGVTMGNLFRGWPKDRIGQIWAHHRFELDTDVCERNLRLGAHTMPGHSWVPMRVRAQQGLMKRLRLLLRPGARLDYPSALAWARAFEPDVIYSQPTPYPMYTWWLPRWLARDLGVPLVNHVMDDWPSSMAMEWGPPTNWFLQPLLDRQLRGAFATAACNMVISKQMADAFRRRYGTEFVPFHNTVDLDEWASPRTDYSSRAGAFRVVYLGALAEHAQALSLRDIALAIASLAQSGRPVSLTVYTGPMYIGLYEKYLAGIPGVAHGGAVARADLCAQLARADLLALPVNFDARSLSMMRYSMPTKAPEYMASGTPVLVYAPRSVPPAQYALNDGWGYVVDTKDGGCLAEALAELMDSEQLRARLGRRARELAVRNHDARKVRQDFREVLCRAAAGQRAGPARQPVGGG